jgi:hypothetical protein
MGIGVRNDSTPPLTGPGAEFGSEIDSAIERTCDVGSQHIGAGWTAESGRRVPHLHGPAASRLDGRGSHVEAVHSEHTCYWRQRVGTPWHDDRDSTRTVRLVGYIDPHGKCGGLREFPLGGLQRRWLPESLSAQHQPDPGHQLGD